MGTIILGITGAVYAAFAFGALIFHGKIGFTIWLVLSLAAIAYLKITMQESGGEIIENTWLITTAIIGFVVGFIIHIARAATKSSLLPLPLILIGPLLLVNDFGIFDLIENLVRAF